MRKFDDTYAIKETFLEMLDFKLTKAIDTNSILNVKNTKVRVDYMQNFVNQIIIELTTSIASEKVGREIIKYPKDWFEAFKERWFPTKLLKFFPVIYTEKDIQYTAVYPDFRPAMPKERVFVVKTINNKYTTTPLE